MKKGHRMPERTEEHRRNLSISLMGHKHSQETINKIKEKRKLQVITEEHKSNIRLSHLGNKNYFFGRKHTQESKQKMRMHKIGTTRLFTEEHKAKISIALKGKRSNLKGITRTDSTKNKIRLSKEGFKYSEESKQKMRESHLGKKANEETKRKIKESRSKQVFPLVDSSIEIRIQDCLKELGIVFFTHQYMKIEHGYLCDIFIPSLNMVIECDGNYWHKYPIGKEIDHIRTKELIEKGFKVLRLWEHEIKVISKKDLVRRMSIK